MTTPSRPRTLRIWAMSQVVMSTITAVTIHGASAKDGKRRTGVVLELQREIVPDEGDSPTVDELRLGPPLGDLIDDDNREGDQPHGWSQRHLRSSRCLHVTQCVARGNAWSRAFPMPSPQTTQAPK